MIVLIFNLRNWCLGVIGVSDKNCEKDEGKVDKGLRG